MAKEQPKWKRIAKGDRLPCWSFIRKMDGTVLPLTTIGGAFSGQDAYYLPVKDVIEIIKDFPKEESEGERICGQLIAFLKQSKAVYGDGFKQFGLDIDDALAWLEKQVEQNLAFIEKGKWYVCIRTSYKPNGKDFIEGKTYYAKEDYKIIGECGEVDIATDNPEEFFRSATEEETNDIIKNFVNEQKPAEWSEVDEKMLKDTIRFCELCGNKVSANWLKSIKDRVQPKPQSDERNRLLGKLEEWLDEYVSNLADVDTATLICSFTNYLDGKLPKSLRPQSQWRPSDEQIFALQGTLPVIKGGGTYQQSLLESLYEDLKKLKS